MTVNNPINSLQALAPTSSPTFNALTLTTDLTVPNGGTGASTLTGVLVGNGASAFTASAVTQYNVLIGGASNAVGSVAPGATGIPVISQGVAANPVFGTAIVAGGGTGATTLTDHGVLVGSGASAIDALAVGTNGQLLIGSSAADPVFATVTSSDSLLTLTGGAGSLDVVANRALSASAVLTDNAVVRGDGGARGTQTSSVSISDAGEMTNTLQPGFSAYFASSATNVTGNATGYLFGDTDVGGGVSMTEIYDQGGDFVTGSSTGATLTAPVDSKWVFSASALIQQAGTGNSLDFSIVTSNFTFRGVGFNPLAISDGGSIGVNCTFQTIMDAADISRVNVNLNGTGADTADIYGGASDPRSTFSGWQLG